MAELAEAAGVSTPTIYNSVGGKQAVLLAVVELVDEHTVGDVFARLQKSTDPREIVAMVVAMRRRTVEGAGDILHVFGAAAAAEAEIAEAQRARAERTLERCRQIAGRLQELGALRKGLDVASAGDALYALLHHAIWLRLAGECGWEMARIEAWLADVVVESLLERG